MRHLLILHLHLILHFCGSFSPADRVPSLRNPFRQHQLLILNRSRRHAPNLRALDRPIAGICSLWIKPNWLRRVAIALKPSTLLNFHRALVRRNIGFYFHRSRKQSPVRKVRPRI